MSKEFVLMNKKTGEIGLGIPFVYYEGLTIETNPAFKVCLISGEPEVWGVLEEKSNCYVMVKAEFLKNIEVIGEL